MNERRISALIRAQDALTKPAPAAPQQDDPLRLPRPPRLPRFPGFPADMLPLAA